MERVPPERKRRGKEEAKKRQAREEGFTYYRPSRSIFSIRSVDYSRKFRKEKRGGWRETEPNGNENENENVDERRDLRNAGGKGGWTKKGRGKPRAKAGAVTRNARPGMCYRSCRVPRLRYLHSARTSAIHSFTSDESSRGDVGDAGRGHRYKAEEGTSRRIDKKD